VNQPKRLGPNQIAKSIIEIATGRSPTAILGAGRQSDRKEAVRDC
jgi:hypothetical protein